jgi:FkbM family methyltransferase
MLTQPVTTWHRLRYRRMVAFAMLSGLRRLSRSGGISGIDCIVDVGANIGQYALMAHLVWPEAPVISFEPDPASFTVLQDNFRRYNIPGECVAVALAERDGEAVLHRVEDSSGNSLWPPADATRLRGMVTVRSATLDSYAQRLEQFRARFLKLDVQGGELGVIDGGREVLRCCAYVQVEVLFRSAYRGAASAGAVISALEMLGFELIDLIDVLRAGERGSPILEADLLFRNTHWRDGQWA